jgi:NaMN:DMB phosphoribosyltransferase
VGATSSVNSQADQDTREREHDRIESESRRALATRDVVVADSSRAPVPALLAVSDETEAAVAGLALRFAQVVYDPLGLCQCPLCRGRARSDTEYVQSFDNR